MSRSGRPSRHHTTVGDLLWRGVAMIISSITRPTSSRPPCWCERSAGIGIAPGVAKRGPGIVRAGEHAVFHRRLDLIIELVRGRHAWPSGRQGCPLPRERAPRASGEPDPHHAGYARDRIAARLADAAEPPIVDVIELAEARCAAGVRDRSMIEVRGVDQGVRDPPRVGRHRASAGEAPPTKRGP